MLTRRTLTIVGTVIVSLVFAGSAFAFAAANTVPASTAGSGSGGITGYTVSSITYTLDSTTPTNLDAVNFSISPTAATVVKIQLASGGAWYTCANSSGAVTCNTTSGTQATVAGATQLTVVATQ